METCAASKLLMLQCGKIEVRPNKGKRGRAIVSFPRMRRIDIKTDQSHQFGWASRRHSPGIAAIECARADRLFFRPAPGSRPQQRPADPRDAHTKVQWQRQPRLDL